MSEELVATGRADLALHGSLLPKKGDVFKWNGQKFRVLSIERLPKPDSRRLFEFVFATYRIYFETTK